MRCDRCGTLRGPFHACNEGYTGDGEFIYEMLCPICAMVSDAENLGLYVDLGSDPAG